MSMKFRNQKFSIFHRSFAKEQNTSHLQLQEIVIKHCRFVSNQAKLFLRDSDIHSYNHFIVPTINTKINNLKFKPFQIQRNNIIYKYRKILANKTQ